MVPFQQDMPKRHNRLYYISFQLHHSSSPHDGLCNQAWHYSVRLDPKFWLFNNNVMIEHLMGCLCILMSKLLPTVKTKPSLLIAFFSNFVNKTFVVKQLQECLGCFDIAALITSAKIQRGWKEKDSISSVGTERRIQEILEIERNGKQFFSNFNWNFALNDGWWCLSKMLHIFQFPKFLVSSFPCQH